MKRLNSEKQIRQGDCEVASGDRQATNDGFRKGNTLNVIGKDDVGE